LLPSVALADDPPEPVVHIDAPSSVLLERVDANGERTPICHAPCDRRLDTRPRYVLTADGVRASNSIELPSRAAPLDLSLEPSSSRSFTSGVVLTTIGAVFLAGGLALVGGGLFAGSSGYYSFFNPMLWLAAASGTVSLATGIPGLVMLASNAHSRATVMWGDEHVAERTVPAAHGPMVQLTGRF